MASQSLEELLPKLRAAQPSLRERFGVSGLWVFGSYARGESGSDSDLDVLVEFDKGGLTLFQFLEIEMELADLLGVAVDLVQRKALRPDFRSEVLSEAIAV